MTIPTLIFGGLVATLYGAIFHLIRGGGFGKMLVYILLSWAGFWAGHFIAERIGWSFVNIGSLHLGLATISSFIFMIIGYWILLGRSPSE